MTSRNGTEAISRHFNIHHFIALGGWGVCNAIQSSANEAGCIAQDSFGTVFLTTQDTVSNNFPVGSIADIPTI